MPTPSGLPTKTDFQNATLDVEHLGRVVNSKDAQGNPITTSTNRTGGVNKTLDALETEYTEAIRNAGGQPLGDGTWQVGQTFTAYNQFMVYNGIAYKPLTTTTLPYGPTGATPDLAFVGPFTDNIYRGEWQVGISVAVTGDIWDYQGYEWRALVNTSNAPTEGSEWRNLTIKKASDVIASTGVSVEDYVTERRYEMKLSEFGAVPGSAFDQGAIIQAALEECATKRIKLLVDGEYWLAARATLMDDGVLSRNNCIYVPSGTRMEFLSGSCFRQIPDSNQDSYILNFYLKNDIVIENPVVYGDKDTHLDTLGEWGHGYNITSCSNVTLINPKAYDCWGDGFYVGLEFLSTISKHLENVTVIDAEYENASRNGLSFTSGKNVIFKLKHGGRVDRTSPKAGVDFEPEFGNGAPISPTYENCHLWLNLKGQMVSGVLFYLNSPDRLEKCELTIHNLETNIDGVPLQLTKQVQVNTKGKFQILNFSSLGTEVYPVQVSWAKDNLNFYCNNCITQNSNNVGSVEDPQDTTINIYDTIGSVDSGGFYFNKIQRLNESLTPVFVRNRASKLVDYSLNFESEASKNSGPVRTSGILTKAISAELKIGFFNNSQGENAVGEITLEPATFDGVTINLSNLVRFKQIFTKAIVNSFPIKFKASVGNTLNFGGTNYTTVQSTSVGAKCEIHDDGNGNKILVPLSGSWTGA